MEGHRKNTYLISTASMLDKATLPQALRWRIEDHARLARDTGFDGIELWPQRIHPLRQIKQDNISSDERASIHSLHQSVRQSAWRIRSLREAKREVQKAFFLYLGIFDAFPVKIDVWSGKLILNAKDLFLNQKINQGLHACSRHFQLF